MRGTAVLIVPFRLNYVNMHVNCCGHQLDQLHSFLAWMVHVYLAFNDCSVYINICRYLCILTYWQTFITFIYTDAETITLVQGYTVFFFQFEMSHNVCRESSLYLTICALRPAKDGRQAEFHTGRAELDAAVVLKSSESIQEEEWAHLCDSRSDCVCGCTEAKHSSWLDTALDFDDPQRHTHFALTQTASSSHRRSSVTVIKVTLLKKNTFFIHS